MDARLERYRAAGLKAVEFQLTHQQPDGAFTWEGFPRDAYHKQPYSWSVAGYLAAAHKLLNWVKANTLLPDGQLRDYNGDVYKLSWFFQGAHRMGRFDISHPAMGFLLSTQTPCGGFPHFPKDKLLRVLPSAWMGVSALYFGRLEIARKVGEWCVHVLDQQRDESRFYYCTTREGNLATSEVDPRAAFVDLTKPRQCYWEIGLPWLLMGRLYQATAEAKYLELAKRFFDLHLRCQKDAFCHTGSGKSSLAAAVHYLNTGDPRARDAVYTFCDYLVETQHPEGGWRPPSAPDQLLYYIDAAAEFNVWLQENVAILASREQGVSLE
jgi:hypothetical protein